MVVVVVVTVEAAEVTVDVVSRAVDPSVVPWAYHRRRTQSVDLVDPPYTLTADSSDAACVAATTTDCLVHLGTVAVAVPVVVVELVYRIH